MAALSLSLSHSSNCSSTWQNVRQPQHIGCNVLNARQRDAHTYVYECTVCVYVRLFANVMCKIVIGMQSKNALDVDNAGISQSSVFTLHIYSVICFGFALVE